MNKQLRLSGIIFGCVFLAGYLLNAIFYEESVGFIPGLYTPTQLSLIAAAGLFFLSAAKSPLRWIQPAIFLILAPIPIIQQPENIFGLGFYIMGVLLTERAGFFLKHRAVKMVVMIAYLLVVEIVAVIASTAKNPIQDALYPTFYIIAFGLFLWFLYKDRLVVFLKEPKPKLSLAGKGISPAERTFVLETLKGRSQKEIAVDFDLSESTIRNTLARSYKKLGVEDRVGLAVLGERFEVVE